MDTFFRTRSSTARPHARGDGPGTSLHPSPGPPKAGPHTAPGVRSGPGTGRSLKGTSQWVCWASGPRVLTPSPSLSVGTPSAERGEADPSHAHSPPPASKAPRAELARAIPCAEGASREQDALP